MSEQLPLSLEPRGFDRADVMAAIAHADRAVTRDAMRLHNPHDLNNIRQQIHAAAMITRGGEPRFHMLMELMAKSNTNPLIYNAYAMIAKELNITLTPEEAKAVAESGTSVKAAKASAAQQPEDRQIDMRALKQRITPHHMRLGEIDPLAPMQHNSDAYYDQLLAEGYSENSAYRNAAQFSLTLSRIGQSLERFSPKFNNPVDFLDLVTERVLAYNRRKQPNTRSDALDAYVRGWRDEVKRDFMHVDPAKTEQVRNVIHTVAHEILNPQQKPSRGKRRPSDTYTRSFRDLAEGYELRRTVPPESYGQIAQTLQQLGNQFTERYDPERVTQYLQSFMLSDAYKQLQRCPDPHIYRTVDLAIGEICTRLDVPFPAELEGKEYLLKKFAEDKRRNPNADDYWRRTIEDVRDAVKAKESTQRT